jgi:hypothetical protein
MWDYKEVVLPADASKGAVEKVVKEEAEAGWTLDRTEPHHGDDTSFKTYFFKKLQSEETLEEKLTHDIEAGLLPDEPEKVESEPESSEKFSGPEGPPSYKPVGNF